MGNNGMVWQRSSSTVWKGKTENNNYFKLAASPRLTYLYAPVSPEEHIPCRGWLKRYAPAG
jgi:hypothetical protein